MMANPIRVLQVVSKMNRGGAETMIMNLYRNIDRSKVQFDFIVHSKEKCAYDDEIESLGGKIYKVPQYIGKNHIQYIKAWEDFFQMHHEYKIIHGHVRSTAVLYLRIAKKYGLTTIAHSHSTSSGVGFIAIMKNIFQYPIRYTADYFFACSKAAGEWLYGKKVCNSSNFHIIYNAIDFKSFIFNENKRTKARKEFGVEDKLVIGHVGRFHSSKNHEFIIDIFKEVHEINEETKLLLIGDGKLRETIENKVSRLALKDSVIFAGIRTDVSYLLQAMDIYVFPSLFEGFPVTLIEAQAAGLTCIISDTITKEVCITPLVIQLPLSLSAKEWAEIILKQNIQRVNTKLYFEHTEFDINNLVEKLTEFYIRISKD
ncbi:MAG: glycosyltransferase family 1 protein [Mahellales bacterium]|jgi:glycosyltransferase involved in cell wall biosynthesis